jgi:hypothetical protein
MPVFLLLLLLLLLLVHPNVLLPLLALLALLLPRLLCRLHVAGLQVCCWRPLLLLLLLMLLLLLLRLLSPLLPFPLPLGRLPKKLRLAPFRILLVHPSCNNSSPCRSFFACRKLCSGCR